MIIVPPLFSQVNSRFTAGGGNQVQQRKIAAMDDIKALCEKKNVLLLEDCAHSLCVLWNGGHTGHHGAMAATGMARFSPTFVGSSVLHFRVERGPIKRIVG